MWVAVFLLPLLIQGILAKSAECEQCDFTVDLLHEVWGDNITGVCVGDLAVVVCDTFKIEDNFVCKGMVGDFKDEFIWVLGQIIVEPHQICGLLMNDCGNPFDPMTSSWPMYIPENQPPPVDKQPVQPGKPTMKVLHLTDIHLDMQYQVGLEAQCEEPQCCRPKQDPDEATAGGAKVKEPAGKWGTVGNCDAPYWTLHSQMQWIKDHHNDLSHILVSGDLMSHADWDYTPTSHAAMINNISDTIRSYFPNIPVFFSVGNHEGVPIDNIAPKFTPKQYHMDWLYNAMAQAWHGWVPDDQNATLHNTGSYMVKLFPGLRLISLNNVYGDSNNFWLYVNQTDPDGSMTWFMDQLFAAEAEGDKVHVVAHVTGSSGECFEGWALNYYKLVNRFQNTIVGQFFGHTHSARYYMIYENPDDAHSRPTGMVYSAPSLTTYSEYNPGYRIYTMDGNYSGSSFQVIDFEDWYLNLTVANLNPTVQPQWTQLFASANQQYGLKAQTPIEWNNLAERMRTDTTTFELYRENYYRRNQYDGVPSCGEGCRMSQICDIRQFHHSSQLCSDLGVTPVYEGSVYRRPSKPATVHESLLHLTAFLKTNTFSTTTCPI